MAKMTKEQIKLMHAAIAACKDRNGVIRPELVVKAAQNPKTEGQRLLNKRFPWDVKRAAWERWLDIARDLIREVKFTIVYQDRQILVPTYVVSRDQKPGYVETQSLLGTPAAEATLEDELTRIEGAINRAKALAVAFDLVVEFDRMLERVGIIRARMAERGKRRRNPPDNRPQAP